MTDATYRATIVALQSAAVFLLAVIASTLSFVGADWIGPAVSALMFVGAIGVVAGAYLFLAAAGAGRRLE